MQSVTHPKIAVENKKDILFLKQEIMKYAQSALSEHDLSTVGNPEHVKEEVEEQLLKWVEMTFEMASDSIEINGMAYREAFEMEQEYEPLNEELRQQADELHHKIQEMLVKLSGISVLAVDIDTGFNIGFRKTTPKQLEQLDAETLQMISKSSESVVIESENIEEQLPAVPIKPVTLDNYSHLCKQQQDLSATLPETLKKAQDIENLLDDLKIPPLGSAKEKTKEELDRQSRRRSSLGKALLSANYLNATPSISSAHHPQEAAEALVKRLEMGIRKRI